MGIDDLCLWKKIVEHDREKLAKYGLRPEDFLNYNEKQKAMVRYCLTFPPDIMCYECSGKPNDEICELYLNKNTIGEKK